MKRFFRVLCAVMTPLCLAAVAAIGFYAVSSPSDYVVATGDTLSLDAPLSVSGAVSGEKESSATLTLFGILPVKQVSVKESDAMQVILGGDVFGMKLYTNGVLVVGLTDVDAAAGSRHPAADAGIRAGDVIESINGQTVSLKSEVAALIEQSGGKPMTLRVVRDQVTFTVRFSAVLSAGECRYKAGLWVRDSSAGIGTVTFTVPATGVFAGLGHPICDVDTGEVLPISSGEIVPARIYGINRGTCGDAGELCGGFDGDAYGVITANGERGVYGILDRSPRTGECVYIASRQEVTTGAAQIRCTLDNTGARWFDVEIVKIRRGAGTPDMEIRVTDEALLTATGGIVQGMSGSPIIQNGKLIGAITHVLVDDPTTGYAIFAENMLETAQSVASENKLKDAS